MPKYLNLQINEPCHEDWNAMTPNEQGRFCGSCNKTVVDFTNMTDTQLANYFKLNTGNTCGRFYEDQINKPMVIPRKEIPWLKYFFTITLPAFLFSAKAIAQKKAVVEKEEKSSLKNKKNITKTSVIENSNANQVLAIDTSIIANDIYKLGEVWFNSKTKEPLKEETLQEVIMYSEPSKKTSHRKISGAISVVSSEFRCTTSGINIKALSPKPIKNESKLNIFPNPVPSNSTLNLSFSKDIIGVIVLEIFTANGNLVKKENRTFNAKTKSTFINTNNLPFGFYICVATNTVTNEKLSKEFLVK